MRAFDPHALECLAAILEEGGFERAALRLSITQSAVSQRLRALEAEIGTILIVRSRPVRATSAGRLMLRHAMQMRLLRADLDQDLHGLAPDAGNTREEERMSIAVNADSIATWVLPALTPLVEAGLPLEIIADDQEFTHLWLREGQVIGCVTALPSPLRGCRVASLGVMRYVAVASPAYAGKVAPEGLTAHNFRDMAFVAFNRKDALQAEFVRQACHLDSVALKQRFVPSSEGQLKAVLAGWGASVVPELQIREQLATGQLVNLAPAVSLPVELYWHCWNLDSGLLHALSRALRESAAQTLEPSIQGANASQ